MSQSLTSEVFKLDQIREDKLILLYLASVANDDGELTLDIDQVIDKTVESKTCVKATIEEFRRTGVLILAPGSEEYRIDLTVIPSKPEFFWGVKS